MCKGFKNLFCNNQKTPADYIYEWAKKIDEITRDLSVDLENYETHTDERLSLLEAAAWGTPIDVAALINQEIGEKFARITSGTIGHLVAIGEDHDIVDSGKGVSDFADANHNHDSAYAAIVHTHSEKADKVTEATDGNLAGLDENGNLIDSNYAPSDFAAVDHNHDNDYAAKDHYHSQIINDEDENASVKCGFNSDGGGFIDLYVENQNGLDKTSRINYSNIDNLIRALITPSSSPEDDSTKLITSKAVYDSLQKFSNIVTTLPSLSGASDGDECLYIGQSGTLWPQFGQTYKCQTVLKANLVLDGNDGNDYQGMETALNHAKSLQTVSGGKYIMRDLTINGHFSTLYIDVYPNSTVINIPNLYDNIIADLLDVSGSNIVDFTVDQDSDQSATRRKEWAPKYTQELIPRINIL